MTKSSDNPPPIGFLTVVEDSSHGLFGGYLVLNRAGRPLEFHCTTPVRPNRAQEILYGPTLRPYLYGEQIGRTLLEKGKQFAGIVLTDCEPMLAVAEFTDSPVALVEAQETERGTSGGTDKRWRIDGEHTRTPRLHFVEVGGQRLGLPGEVSAREEAIVVDAIGVAAASLDFTEPFERIRAAIDEARRGGQ